MKQQQIKVRDYFSYSQMSSYLYSPSRFIKNYYYGEKQESCYMDLGTKLHESLRYRRINKSNKEIEKIRQQVPIFEEYEKELKVKFKEIPLLAFFDGFDKKGFTLQEIKTGKTPSLKTWESQMKFYSLMLWCKYKKIPNSITLYYCRTELNDNDQLVLTGDVKVYPIKITIQDILQFSAELVKTYNEIQRLIDSEYQQFGILPAKRSANGRNNHNNKLK